MKKTLNINLSGLVFTLDEDAYSVLQNYLEAIAKHFQNEAGKEEIIADIESRFAEEFSQKRTRSKEVMSVEDVNAIIATLGMVEDFSSETENIKTEPEKNTSTNPRRLYRDTENAMIAGVASGIANYFGTDAVFIRILFVLFTLAGGFAVPLYIILWVITPKAETAAQRAEMKGEPLTIKAIEEHVKSMVAEGKEKLNSLEKKNGQQRLNGFFHEIVRGIKNFFRRFFSFFGSIIGFFLSVGAFLGIIFLGIGSGIAIVHHNDPELGIQIHNYISTGDFFLGVIFLAGAFFFPLFAVFLLGIRLMKKRSTFNGYIVSIMVVLWAGSLIGSGILMSKIMPQIYQMRNDIQAQNQADRKTITPEITAFKNLKISGSYEVQIQTGETLSLQASGIDRDLQNLFVENTGSELQISHRENAKFCFFCESSRVKLVLTVPTSTFATIELNGSNMVTVDSMNGDTFTIDVEGSNTVEGLIRATQLNIHSDGNNRIKLAGEVDAGKFEIDGASRVEASDLRIKNLKLDIDGISRAEIWVTDTIEGKLDGIAKVEYRVKPLHNNLEVRGMSEEEQNLPESPQLPE